MSVVRRARGICPACQKDVSKDTGDGRIKTLSTACPGCAGALALPVGADWHAVFRVGGRVRRRKVGPSKASAEKVERKLRTLVAEGKFLDETKRSVIRLPALVAAYQAHLQQTRRRPASAARDMASINLFTTRFLVSRKGSSAIAAKSNMISV
jgi:hypothetical protein